MTKNTYDVKYPTEDGESHKFIQLEIGDKIILAIGDLRHGKILEGTLIENKIINFDTFVTDQGFKFPKAKDPRYELVGAGKCNRDFKGTIFYWGVSVDYNIKTNKDHLEKCKPFIEAEVIVK